MHDYSNIKYCWLLARKYNIIILYHFVTIQVQVQVKSQKDLEWLYSAVAHIFKFHICVIVASAKLLQYFLWSADGERWVEAAKLVSQWSEMTDLSVCGALTAAFLSPPAPHHLTINPVIRILLETTNFSQTNNSWYQVKIICLQRCHIATEQAKFPVQTKAINVESKIKKNYFNSNPFSKSLLLQAMINFKQNWIGRI